MAPMGYHFVRASLSVPQTHRVDTPSVVDVGRYYDAAGRDSASESCWNATNIGA